MGPLHFVEKKILFFIRSGQCSGESLSGYGGGVGGGGERPTAPLYYFIHHNFSPSLTHLRCLVPQALLCKRFPSWFYSPPTSHSRGESLASSVLFLLFTLQKNLWNILPADSPSAITRYLSLFKYLYFHFGGVLVTIKSSVPNLPSLNQTFINSLDRSSASFHGWNPGFLMHFSYTIGSFKLGQDEEGREERKW